MIWGQKMDKNEKLWFSTKKRPSYHNILWSEDFKDTRCCGERANKICLLFGEKCMKNKEKDYICARKIAKAPYSEEFSTSFYRENYKNDFFDDEYRKILDAKDDWRHA